MAIGIARGTSITIVLKIKTRQTANTTLAVKHKTLYSFLSVSTGFAFAAFRIVELVVNNPTLTITRAERMIVKMPTEI